MTQDPLTLYKLIVLYMLGRVTFPLTRMQITDYILDREYTNYMTMQTIFSQLCDNNMILEKTVRNRTQLFITEEGEDTLHFFENRISPEIKKDVDSYLKEKSMSLKNEVSVLGEYYKGTDGEYKSHLSAIEKSKTLVDITLSVPSEEIASHICEQWERKNQEIYQYLIEQLF